MSHLLGYVVMMGGPNLFPAFFIGTAGVDLFFVISGFVMVYSSTNLFGITGGPALFIRKRLSRIVPLYWIITVVWILFRIANRHPEVWQPIPIIASLTFWPCAKSGGTMEPIYGIGWTLNSEMFFYALFSVGLLCSQRVGLGILVTVLCTIVALGLSLPLEQPFRFWAQPVTLDFIFGILLALAYQRGIRIPASYAVAIGLLGILALGLSAALGYDFAPNGNDGLLRPTMWGLSSAAVFTAIVMREGGRFGSNSVVGFLGNASYSIYLVHPLVIIAFWPLSERLIGSHAHASTFWSVLQIASIFALIMIVAVIVHLTIEKPLMWVFRTHKRSSLIAAA